MTTGGLLVLLLLILIVLSVPNWGFNARWGYTPTAGLGALLVVLLLLVLLGVV